MTPLPAPLQALLALIAGFLASDPTPPAESYESATAKPAAVESFEQARDLLADQDRFWTAPYIVADLEEKEIFVWGEYTGMNASEPVEFFVIAENSGHEYEAIMTAFAAPSDLHTALEKIDLSPGAPVNPDAHRFWPRGDRVIAEFLHHHKDKNEPAALPVEATIAENDNPMRPEPWVFTGSPRQPPPNNPEGEPVYAADLFSPNSIASTFNLRHTVFDLPRQGTKSQTYGDFIRRGGFELEEGAPLILRLRPAPENSYPTPLDWQVDISGSDPEVTLAGEHLPDAETLEDLGAAMNQRENEEHFLEVRFDPGMPLGDLVKAARKVQLIEQHVDTARVGPPAKGRMYYRAFIPDPKFRNRSQRPSQPVELHLTQTGATVMELTEIWGDDHRNPDVAEKRKALDSPEDWIHYLDQREDRPNVLFLYADETATHRELLSWAAPVLDRFPVIFVYTRQEP